MGRYVDGLLGALALLDADLAVVCQRTDAERYARLLPSARIVPGPAAVAHRPARLAWEQTGLPLVAQQVKALGGANIAMIETLKVIGEKGVRITPDILASGGGSDGGGGGIGQLLLLNLFKEQMKNGKPHDEPTHGDKS